MLLSIALAAFSTVQTAYCSPEKDNWDDSYWDETVDVDPHQIIKTYIQEAAKKNKTYVIDADTGPAIWLPPKVIDRWYYNPIDCRRVDNQAQATVTLVSIPSKPKSTIQAVAERHSQGFWLYRKSSSRRPRYHTHKP